MGGRKGRRGSRRSRRSRRSKSGAYACVLETYPECVYTALVSLFNEEEERERGIFVVLGIAFRYTAT